MAKKGADAAKAKAAKQKKILFVLAGVLVLALGYAFTTVRGLSGGNKAAATPPPVTTSTTTTTTTPTTPAPATTPTPGTSSAPALAGPSTAVTTAVTTTPTQLVAAVAPPAGAGQLQTFSRFASKDPFDASGPKPSSGGSSSAGSGGSSVNSATSGDNGTGPAASQGSGSAGSGASGSKTTTVLPPPTAAVIAVNGVPALVNVAADFPSSSDPVENGIFHLVALTQKTAQITIVGGSYASGSATLTLKVDQPITLVNTADGKRYTLQLYPQGTASPAGSTASTAVPSATPSSSTP